MNDSLNEKEIQKKVRREAFKRNWLLFRQSTLGMIGLGIVFFFFILAILQPILFMTGVWNEMTKILPGKGLIKLANLDYLIKIIKSN